jgi:hypothetical protein
MERDRACVRGERGGGDDPIKHQEVVITLATLARRLGGDRCLLLQDQVGAHAAARELLHPRRPLGAVGVRVEVPLPL